MEIIREKKITKSIRVSVQKNGNEMAHAYLYLLKNDSHSQCIGYMEDVFVEEDCRGMGVGTKIIQELIKEAKRQRCYKLVGTSRDGRERTHALYRRLGFVEWGREFRMNFSGE